MQAPRHPAMVDPTLKAKKNRCMYWAWKWNGFLVGRLCMQAVYHYANAYFSSIKDPGGYEMIKCRSSSHLRHAQQLPYRTFVVDGECGFCAKVKARRVSCPAFDEILQAGPDRNEPGSGSGDHRMMIWACSKCLLGHKDSSHHGNLLEYLHCCLLVTGIIPLRL